jgi:hypothetical protein
MTAKQRQSIECHILMGAMCVCECGGQVIASGSPEKGS